MGDGSVGESARVMQRRRKEIRVNCSSKEAGDASLSGHRGLCNGGQVGFSLRAYLRKHGTSSLSGQRRAVIEDLGIILCIWYLRLHGSISFSTPRIVTWSNCPRNQSFRRSIEEILRQRRRKPGHSVIGKVTDKGCRP